MNTPDSATYSPDELGGLLGSVGADVRIDRSVRIFGGLNIRVGDRVRIDCFGLLSAGLEGITIGCNVHIAAGCYLFGGGGPIIMEDFSGLSSRVAVYTASDDYTDGYLTNPTVPDDVRKIASGAVVLRKHALVGAGAVILPRVTLGFGAAVGALTVVRKSVADCEIVYGNPMQKLPRKRDGARLRNLESRYLASLPPAGGRR